jgi:hypothetical protein
LEEATVPQQDQADTPLISYVLTKRDDGGERMNPCYFSETSDEAAIKSSAEFLGIPELSEDHFDCVGYFELARKDGPKIFPVPAS